MWSSKVINYICLLIILCACDSGVEFSEADMRFDERNRQQLNVSFKTSKEVTAFINFWNTEDSIYNTSAVSDNSKQHKISLLPLKEETAYDFTISMVRNNDTLTSPVYHFNTLSTPDFLPNFEVMVKEEGFNGYIFLRQQHGPGAQLAIDENGKIVWYQYADSSVFRPFSISSNDSYVALLDKNHILELTFMGDTISEIKNFKYDLHHEIIAADNGFISLTKEFEMFDLNRAGGQKKDTVYGDGIVLFDKEGKIKWHWNIFKSEDPRNDNNISKTRDDWGHANAIGIDKDGDYLISFRDFNQIWKVDSRSGEVIWKLGQDGDLSISKEHFFYQQHAVHLNPDNHIMIFDNGKQKIRPKSRALSFNIDQNQVKSVECITLPDSLFSFKQGSVYYMNENRLLFCSSMTNSLAITDKSGSIKWFAKSDIGFYRATYLEGF